MCGTCPQVVLLFPSFSCPDKRGACILEVWIREILLHYENEKYHCIYTKAVWLFIWPYFLHFELLAATWILCSRYPLVS